MKIVKSDKIKLKILKALSKEKDEISFYSLMKKVKLYTDSLHPNCNFLESLGLIEIRKEKIKGRENIFYFVKITEKGLTFIKTFEKNLSKD
ncbi:MAG: transcriptional regulator [Nanoarchaeota archaeon]|nr:transcriptional regulator [Nanoarchaeota archaeon]